jgi:serine/threonine-protein kinase SRK2
LKLITAPPFSPHHRIHNRNTAETDTTKDTAGGDTCSSLDLAECPFAGHAIYQPQREMYRQAMGSLLYTAIRRDNRQKVVIKLIERGSSVTNHVLNELITHRKCTGHPYITQLLDVFLTPRYLAIVLERVSGGDLLTRVDASPGGLPEPEVRWFFRQLVIAMSYLHSLGVNNREMKLDNKLLVDPPVDDYDDNNNGNAALEGSAPPPPSSPDASTIYPTVKIQDFCYSKSDQINSDPNSALGSLPYTAPEVLNNTMVVGTHADVWSLGVALFKMATGLYPFERPDDDAKTKIQKVLSRIEKVEYIIPDRLSGDLKDLLSKMLVAAPQKRITLEKIFQHPWFNKDLPSGIEAVTYEASSCHGMGMMTGAGMAKVEPSQPEEEVVALVKAAQEVMRPLDSDNIEEMADEILNEEEVDDILDELCLAEGDLASREMQWQ